MVKFLAIGDTHFKSDNIPNGEELMSRILNIVKESELDFVVLLGDILHTFEKVHVIPLNLAIRFIDSLRNILPTYVLIGNHDRINNSEFLTETHPLYALKFWDNTFIIDSSYSCTIKGHKLCFIPYVYPGLFMDALNIIDNWEKSSVIFAHQEFKGAKMGIVKSKKGDSWDSKYPYVISGHIHEYQRLDNILYVGTPMQISYAETQKKSVSIINIDPNIKEERIYLNIQCKSILRINYSQIDTTCPPESCKIIISGTKEEIAIAKKMNIVKKWKEDHIVDYKKMKDNSPYIDVDISLSFKDGLMKYMKKKDKDLYKVFMKML
jgi:DNA repair exonuclease SbcCD nuclease subunit